MPLTRSGLFYGKFEYQFYYPDKSVYPVDIDFDEAKFWVGNQPCQARLFQGHVIIII